MVISSEILQGVSFPPLIKGGPLHTLRICQTENVLNPGYFHKHPDQLDRTQIEVLKTVAEKWVQRVVIR